MYDVARIDERFGLRPDQMIDYKALKGDPTDNIPGVPGVGEKTAAKLIREFGDLDALFARIDEVTPEKLRDKLREHRDQIAMGRDLSTIVRDLPVELDLEAARLGDYDRDTVVRLFREYEFRTLIERLPPMAGEIGRAARGEPASPSSTSGYVPAARVAGRPDGLGPGSRPTARPSERRAPAAPRLRRGRPARGAATRARTAPRTDGAPSRAILEPADDLPTALAAAIVDPGRIEVRGADRIADLEPWLAAQPAVGVSLLARRPAAAPRHAARARGRRARTVAWSRPTAPRRPTRSAACSSGSARRSSGTRSSRSSSRAFADDPASAPLPVAFDTQIAAYVLNAALRSQTIADVVAENLDQILPPADGAARDGPRRSRGALGASPSASRSSGASTRSSLDRLFREIELPLIPVLARMEAIGRRARPRGAGASSTASSAPRSPGSSRRSTSTSATSSTSAAPSSSSRSCSSSSTCRRASGRRPATRPTRRCSRSCGRRTR